MTLDKRIFPQWLPPYRRTVLDEKRFGKTDRASNYWWCTRIFLFSTNGEAPSPPMPAKGLIYQGLVQ